MDKQTRAHTAKERDMTRKQERRNKQTRQAFFFASLDDANKFANR